MKKPATDPIVANLEQGDRVFYVFSEALPGPATYNTLCITHKQWLKRRHKDNELGSLIIGSQLFNLLNTLKPGQTARKPLSDGYLVGVTLLEIHKKKREWYIFTLLKRCCTIFQTRK